MPVPEETTETLPAPLATDLPRRLAASPGVLLGLDFDGTLAPIDADPDAPTLDPETAPALQRLATHPAARVAVVSGRQVEDLVDRVGLQDLTYAGNHGLERRRNGRTETLPAARRYRPAIARVVQHVTDRLGSVPGWELEDKGVTATVHYRSVSADRVPAVTAAVERAVAEVAAPLTVTRGKEIIEVRPPIDWDKGSLLETLAAEVPADWLSVYVGDDTTDEDAFTAVEPWGIGIRVGDPSEPTAASAVLPERRQVRALLRLVVDRLDATR
ncbi:trehalose-phosphatase [Halobacteriales archaeon Cl-PHB]